MRYSRNGIRGRGLLLASGVPSKRWEVSRVGTLFACLQISNWSIRSSKVFNKSNKVFKQTFLGIHNHSNPLFTTSKHYL